MISDYFFDKTYLILRYIEDFMASRVVVELHDHGMVDGGRYRIGITASHGYPKKFVYCEMDADGSSPSFVHSACLDYLPDDFVRFLSKRARDVRKSRGSRSFDYDADSAEYKAIEEAFETGKPVHA